MGQAWCKEKTTKAQDSKSPLDRVFVRCAHRIYPSLKDEGSVLGGATQRVTSSEIGYAGSPPRHVLARGRSVDSVDRPFQPSDWVDVNLEAPSTPRGSSAFANVTLEQNLYPTTPASSNHSTTKDATPIPPPRRRKQKNKDRPLPPKPDEVAGNSSNGKLKRVDTNEEPFYTCVKPPQDEERVEETTTTTTTSHGGDVVDGQPCRVFNKHSDSAKHEDRRNKEIYEHKVNGTGKIIPSDVVSGKKTSSRNNGVPRTSDSSRRRKSEEIEEYERFARSRSIENSSTPNHRDSKDQERLENSSVKNGKVENRPKNYSTASLPNYELLGTDVTKRDESPEETSFKRLVRNSTTGSLPVETFLHQVSKSHFDDSVMKDEIDEDGFVKYDPKKLEDWDFSDVSNCGSNHRQRSFQSSPISEIVGENIDIDKQFQGKDSTSRNQRENETDGGKGKSLSADDASFPGGKLQKSSLLQKPEAFGKTPLPDEADANSMFSKNVDDWIAVQNSQLRYFDPPTLKETCKISPVCERKLPSGEPFFLVEQNLRTTTKNSVEESSRNGGIEKSGNFAATGRLFERRLSNESEPFEDSYEEKDLPHIETPISSKLIKAISEESLPREMLEDNEDSEDFFAEKLSKDARNELAKDCTDSGILKTPSPSPEPRIKAEILDNDHSVLLKVLKEETAEESNLSSMTPSLTELEAALSDMLEKDGAEEEVSSIPTTETESSNLSKVTEKPIEPSIVPVAKSLKDESADKNLVDVRKDDPAPLPPNRKISFCAWEEIDLPDTRHSASEQKTPDASSQICARLTDHQEDSTIRQTVAEEPPEKPSRLYAAAENAESIPMPPRRKNRSNPSAIKDEPTTLPENSRTTAENDRLI